MKTANDVVKGKIVDIDEHGVVTIKAYYDDWFTMLKRGYKECNIQMIDSRHLSNKQRNACYALLREISEFTGNGLDSTKEWMKLKFLCEDLQQTGDTIFSLSNAPMSLVCAFQRYIVRFILEWDIPTKFPLLNMVDDIGDYIYNCLINKKCCVCGQHCDLHHVDTVGMGRDREEIIHEGMEVLPLCREHHREYHDHGYNFFKDKYHIERGIILDKTLCKIYHLKANKKTRDD